jgi:hypothetical protein
MNERIDWIKIVYETPVNYKTKHQMAMNIETLINRESREEI